MTGLRDQESERVDCLMVSVPEFFHFIRPALEAVIAEPGEHWRVHLAQVMSRLGLTEADYEDVTPGSGKPRIEDRMLWALTYLRAAKLIENAGRGKNIATERGRSYVLRAPMTVKPADLQEFPEFATFYKGSGVKRKDRTDEQSITTASDTPQERIEQAYTELRAALAADVLERLLATHPARFERIIVDLMLKMGYGGSGEDAGQVVGKSGDGGIDGIIRQDHLGLDNIYLQAKRWQGSVGTAEINSFIGALTTRGANKGVMITTSTFSDSAKKIASSAPHLKLSLIDGARLALLLIDHDLGVAPERPITLKRIDSDYFADD